MPGAQSRPVAEMSANVLAVLSKEEEALMWHRRFGHVSMRVIRRLMKDNMATGLPSDIENVNFTCLDCLRSKSLHLRTLGPTGSSPGPLELIVADVGGPYKASFGGVRYMATFRDVATTYSEVITVAKRDTITRHFQDFVAKVEQHTPYKVKHFRSDGAGEYTCAAMVNWCASKGISCVPTNPYEHQQNGVAERFIRTINDMGRTMLHAANLGEDMWAFAHTTAAYLHNRLPNVHTGRKTPIELLFGKKPHLEGVRVFGEPAVVHVPHEKRRKMDLRGVEAIFAGYVPGKKGWRFYQTATKKVFESSLAVFLSDKAPVVTEHHEPNADKGSLSHILNAMELGKFNAEEAVILQDKLVEQVSKSEVDVDPAILKTYAAAMHSPFALKWREACETEVRQLEDMKVFEVCDLPSGARVTDTKWVFTLKRDSEN